MQAMNKGRGASRAVIGAGVLGVLAGGASADVVIRPTAAVVSTWRSCVPPENMINSSGLPTGSALATGGLVPSVWPAHATGGCNNMWHSSCVGQPNNTGCEGGDLAPTITFDLGAEWTLSAMRLWNHNQVAPNGTPETNRGWRTVTVAYSADNVSYTAPVQMDELAQAPGTATYAGDDYTLPPGAARYVRFAVVSNWGSTAATGLSEVRFVGTRLGVTSVTVSAPPVEDCGARTRVVRAQVADITTAPGATMVADLSELGLGDVTMLDNGVAPDEAAGDGVFSATFPLAGSVANGAYELSVTLTTPAGTVSAAGSVVVDTCRPTISEVGDAGELPATAQVAQGLSGTLGRILGALSASDVDMYKVRICEPSLFRASTEPGTAFDTQLFLFNDMGVGVAFNDDNAGNSRSTIDASLVSTPGDYFLAVTAYNRDPQNDAGQLLWNNTPFTGVRAPDGPGAASPVAQWVNTVTTTGAYTITLDGACFVGDSACGPSDVAGSGQTIGADGDLSADDIIVFVNWFFASDARADIAGAGQTVGADGTWSADDLILFINRFFAGC